MSDARPDPLNPALRAALDHLTATRAAAKHAFWVYADACMVHDPKCDALDKAQSDAAVGAQRALAAFLTALDGVGVGADAK